MKKYNCNIEGKNFLLDFNNKTSKHGFYKWVTVSAENPEDAELKAIDYVKDDAKKSLNVKNPKEDPPMLYLVEIHESEEDLTDSGYTFYKEI